ncbi:MAG: methyltransferase domain-containing protein [Phycisphaeraceae bacterium]|nr:MAG: methyltransferase domain-containing protein [Phycisphaeraceae bacterium]
MTPGTSQDLHDAPAVASPHDDGAHDVHDREIDFHDHWADSVPIADRLVRESFEAPTAPENRFIVQLINRTVGPLNGLRVLDIGCGLGESSVYFATQGADVTATDISPGMVRTTEQLAQAHGVSVRGVVSEAESLGIEDNSFDVVYIANLIHHVTDKDALWRQVSAALRPGGLFVSWDPLRYNPVINVYRRMATEVRTDDEFPLGFDDARRAAEHFSEVGHREFWIATLALFAKYYAIDRVHPNADRYWKRILKESPASLWWWRPLALADSVLTRLPLVRRLAWNMVMWGRKV